MTIEPDKTSRSRISVVEDETLIRRMFEVTFRSVPVFVLVGSAGTGQRAIEELQHLDVDAVVMDFGLPDADGIEVTRQLVQMRPGLKIDSRVYGLLATSALQAAPPLCGNGVAG